MVIGPPTHPHHPSIYHSSIIHPSIIHPSVHFPSIIHPSSIRPPSIQGIPVMHLACAGLLGAQLYELQPALQMGPQAGGVTPGPAFSGPIPAGGSDSARGAPRRDICCRGAEGVLSVGVGVWRWADGPGENSWEGGSGPSRTGGSGVGEPGRGSFQANQSLRSALSPAEQAWPEHGRPEERAPG